MSTQRRFLLDSPIKFFFPSFSIQLQRHISVAHYSIRIIQSGPPEGCSKPLTGKAIDDSRRSRSLQKYTSDDDGASSTTIDSCVQRSGTRGQTAVCVQATEDIFIGQSSKRADVSVVPEYRKHQFVHDIANNPFFFFRKVLRSILTGAARTTHKFHTISSGITRKTHRTRGLTPSQYTLGRTINVKLLELQAYVYKKGRYT